MQRQHKAWTWSTEIHNRYVQHGHSAWTSCMGEQQTSAWLFRFFALVYFPAAMPFFVCARKPWKRQKAWASTFAIDESSHTSLQKGPLRQWIEKFKFSRPTIQEICCNKFWKSVPRGDIRQKFVNKVREMFIDVQYRVRQGRGWGRGRWVSPKRLNTWVESWPNTTSAWADCSKFDIPVGRYGGVHSLLICTSSTRGSSTCTRLASREILIEQNIKKRTGPALWLLCGYPSPPSYPAVHVTVHLYSSQTSFAKYCTVNPAKLIRVWKLHPAKRARGQRSCVVWKSVCRVC